MRIRTNHAIELKELLGCSQGPRRRTRVNKVALVKHLANKSMRVLTKHASALRTPPAMLQGLRRRRPSA